VMAQDQAWPVRTHACTTMKHPFISSSMNIAHMVLSSSARAAPDLHPLHAKCDVHSDLTWCEVLHACHAVPHKVIDMQQLPLQGTHPPHQHHVHSVRQPSRGKAGQHQQDQHQLMLSPPQDTTVIPLLATAADEGHIHTCLIGLLLQSPYLN